MTQFDKAMVNAEIQKQNKAAERKAKKAYIEDLVKQGLDRQVAEVMAQVNFEYGLVKTM